MNLASNLGWNSLSQVLKILVQLVSLLYLAKIVHPDQYGLMAIAATFMNFGILLRDLGTASALIQKRNIQDGLINTVFWINLLMGLILCGGLIAASPFASRYYGQPKLEPILLLLSFTFPLSSCAAAHLALMERESLFKQISKIEIISSVTALVIALILANLNWGVYSLVFQALTQNLISAVQIWTHSKWKPKSIFRTNFGEVKEIFGFSANLSAFNFVNYFSRNSDSIIIGKFMSPGVLGCYNLAYRIMLFPVQSLTFIAARSIFPILSTYQDDNDRVKSSYFKCVFIIFAISAPLMTTVAIVANEFVDFFWGARWHLTAQVLAWLAPTAIIQSINSTSGSVFAAKGKTGLMFALGCISTVLQVGAFIIGVKYSVVFLAELYFFANLLNSIVTLEFALRLIDSSLLALLRIIFPIAFSCLISGVTLFLLKMYSGAGNFDVLFVFPIFSSLIYLAMLYRASTEFKATLLDGLRRFSIIN
jgi:O-antigen/teichoic acid export membrane protein